MIFLLVRTNRNTNLFQRDRPYFLGIRWRITVITVCTSTPLEHAQEHRKHFRQDCMLSFSFGVNDSPLESTASARAILPLATRFSSVVNW
jgi:hypothetical protein